MNYPIILDTWTEYERGWGSRPDGVSVHLTAKDHKMFVDAFNKKNNNRKEVPDEYTTADQSPSIIDAEEPLYTKLCDLLKQGVHGIYSSSREDEKLLRQGKNPDGGGGLYNVVLSNLEGKPLDPKGLKLSLREADRRVQAFRNLGIEAVAVKITSTKGKKKVSP